MKLIVNTDGACHGNPGPGGYCAWWEWNNERWEVLGGALSTTNNRMEMGAIVAAMRAIEQAKQQGLIPADLPVLIRSDSQYVVKGCLEWRAGWKRKGWKGSDGKPVKNLELWQEIDRLLDACPFPLALQWVKGHAGDPGNEHADALAQEAVGVVKSQKQDSFHLRRRTPLKGSLDSRPLSPKVKG